MAKIKPLGKTQTAVLDLVNERHRKWYPNCGWYWGSPSETERILKSLVNRGLVIVETHGGVQIYQSTTSK